jgi:DUF1707 SHOCT-like domain
MQRDEPIDTVIRHALRLGPARSDLRASDADREATAELLRSAHRDGRLDTAELEERLHDCYAAKSYGELDSLVTDLPRPCAREATRPRRWPLQRLAPIVVVPIVVVLAATLAWHSLWLLWALLVFVCVRSVRRGRCFRTRRSDYVGSWQRRFDSRSFV